MEKCRGSQKNQRIKAKTETEGKSEVVKVIKISGPNQTQMKNVLSYLYLRARDGSVGPSM